jgi:hypothetical protein
LETPILDDILARLPDALERDDIGAATPISAIMNGSHIALPPEFSPTNLAKQEASHDDQEAVVC